MTKEEILKQIKEFEEIVAQYKEELKHCTDYEEVECLEVNLEDIGDRCQDLYRELAALEEEPPEC